jgi:NADPH:quinone reductase-like Zn-dependent oxidoreductase
VHAAVLEQHDATPAYREFPDPEPADGAVVVDVAAAALHHLDLLKSSGTFYMGPPPLPSVVGTDGVGRVGERRVFFDATVPPYGTMAERALVPEEVLIDLDADIDDPTAAACGNTGLGAWLALDWRSDLRPGETVLVLGAGGAFGTVAVQAAKLLGAGRVVAATRGARPARGADAVVDLEADDLTEAIREASGGAVDLTIDTLWGEPAMAAMRAAGRHARHVQVGQLAGLEITLSAPAIRSISLDVRGFSVAHPPIGLRREGYRTLTAHVARGDIVLDVTALPLARVGEAWERQRGASGGPKQVLCP